jgi:alanine racemase
VGEGVGLRTAVPGARILVMGPCFRDEEGAARDARLELAVSHPRAPLGVPLHLKVDTGMGRYGLTPDEALEYPRGAVVGLMSHLATADEPDDSFAREQLGRFERIAESFAGVTRHVANSAATLRLPESRLDAVRCGIAVYGLSPFGRDPAEDGLEPVLTWRSIVAKVRTLEPGQSTGYGRRFVAERRTRIGLVPVGYADGFRRGLTGTEVLVEGTRRRVVGTVSMDSFAVELGEEDEAGAEVTLLGEGVSAEEHARHLGTINYEFVCGIRADPARADRTFLDG